MTEEQPTQPEPVGDGQKLDTFTAWTISRDLIGDRRVSVGREVGGDLYAIRYVSPSESKDGEPKVLEFILSREAALATAAGIMEHEFRAAAEKAETVVAFTTDRQTPKQTFGEVAK